MHKTSSSTHAPFLGWHIVIPMDSSLKWSTKLYCYLNSLSQHPPPLPADLYTPSYPSGNLLRSLCISSEIEWSELQLQTENFIRFLAMNGSRHWTEYNYEYPFSFWFWFTFSFLGFGSYLAEFLRNQCKWNVFFVGLFCMFIFGFRAFFVYLYFFFFSFWFLF